MVFAIKLFAQTQRLHRVFVSLNFVALFLRCLKSGIGRFKLGGIDGTGGTLRTDRTVRQEEAEHASQKERNQLILKETLYEDANTGYRG